MIDEETVGLVQFHNQPFLDTHSCTRPTSRHNHRAGYTSVLPRCIFCCHIQTPHLDDILKWTKWQAFAIYMIVLTALFPIEINQSWIVILPTAVWHLTIVHFHCLHVGDAPQSQRVIPGIPAVVDLIADVLAFKVPPLWSSVFWNLETDTMHCNQCFFLLLLKIPMFMCSSAPAANMWCAFVKDNAAMESISPQSHSPHPSFDKFFGWLLLTVFLCTRILIQFAYTVELLERRCGICEGLETLNLEHKVKVQRSPILFEKVKFFVLDTAWQNEVSFWSRCLGLRNRLHFLSLSSKLLAIT